MCTSLIGVRYQNRALRESDNSRLPEAENNQEEKMFQKMEETPKLKKMGKIFPNKDQHNSGSGSEEEGVPNPSRSRRDYPQIIPELLE